METFTGKISMIGHVIRLNVKFNSMESYVTKLWGAILIPKVFLIKQGVFLFDFQSEKQMRGKCLRLVPGSLSSVGISKIASLVGYPIATGKLTATRERLNYARVLLEVKLSLKEALPEQISIQGLDGRSYNQTVLYELKPRWCSLCNIIGHETKKCRRQTTKKKWVPVNKQPMKDAQVSYANVQHDLESKQGPIEKRDKPENSGQNEPNEIRDPAGLLNMDAPVVENYVQKGGNVMEVSSRLSESKAQNSGVTESNMHVSSKHAQSVRRQKNFSSTFRISVVARRPIANDHGPSIQASHFSILDHQCLKSSKQYITSAVQSKDGTLTCLIIIVYALNHLEDRKSLWEELLAFKRNVNRPWLVGGDFNAIINNEEKIVGAPVTDTDTEDFQYFMNSSQLMHIKSIGWYFTLGVTSKM
ncbi:uncharacterized protein LOC109847326 [Asparagus officinalis]|uniref:uncharacterized protein LOC109847326 n=1 Tax=Asparagus officinalis TaxID=4686 RepID=UPI00098E47F5|nr:uncharacterized protein LOC109847326 [Asparagus officinalis]